MHNITTCHKTLNISHITSPPASENQSLYSIVIAHRYKVQGPSKGRRTPEGFAINVRTIVTNTFVREIKTNQLISHNFIGDVDFCRIYHYVRRLLSSWSVIPWRLLPSCRALPWRRLPSSKMMAMTFLTTTLPWCWLAGMLMDCCCYNKTKDTTNSDRYNDNNNDKNGKSNHNHISQHMANNNTRQQRSTKNNKEPQRRTTKPTSNNNDNKTKNNELNCMCAGLKETNTHINSA